MVIGRCSFKDELNDVRFMESPVVHEQPKLQFRNGNNVTVSNLSNVSEISCNYQTIVNWCNTLFIV